jgi:hypothetical protein
MTDDHRFCEGSSALGIAGLLLHSVLFAGLGVVTAIVIGVEFYTVAALMLAFSAWTFYEAAATARNRLTIVIENGQVKTARGLSQRSFWSEPLVSYRDLVLSERLVEIKGESAIHYHLILDHSNPSRSLVLLRAATKIKIAARAETLSKALESV